MQNIQRSGKISRMKMRSTAAAVLFAAVFVGIVAHGNQISAAAWRSVQVQPTPRPRVVVTSAPTLTPTPTPEAAAPKPTPNATGPTLEELQLKIRQKLFSPDVRRGRVGVKIVSLATGKVVFESDADKYFIPASNMKNFTIATAIERLGPDFKFITDIIGEGPVDPAGTVKGNVRIYGRGDISMSTSFDPAFPSATNYFRALDMVADKLAAAGVKRIEGDLIGDESYFRGFAIPPTWEWDDLAAYYGASISALPMNDNVVDVSIRPGTKGGPCIVSILPSTQLVKIINNCITGSSDTVEINRLIDQNVVEVNGVMTTNAKEKKVAIPFSHIADLYIELLKQRLAAKGIIVTGRAFSVSSPPAVCNGCTNAPTYLLGKVESPPLSYIAAKTMKSSQNMYTETILWALGEESGRKSGGSGPSSALGLAAVKKFLTEIGIPADAVLQYDGSGMSRHDQITPSSVITLYTYMAKSRNAQVWRSSLAVGGADGTLRRRFAGTAAAGNFHGKTGTVDQVSALSGYLKTAGGEELAVSFIVNGVPDTQKRISLIDSIVVDLANFAGKVDQ